MAVAALAVFRAFHPRPVALAVVFAAARLFARAAPQRHKRWNIWECVWMSEISQLTGLIYVLVVIAGVVAGVALAVRCAGLAFREALAVHLQAINFCAFAARLIGIAGIVHRTPWGKIHSADHLLNHGIAGISGLAVSYFGPAFLD